jgi:hypothetical protein
MYSITASDFLFFVFSWNLHSLKTFCFASDQILLFRQVHS